MIGSDVDRSYGVGSEIQVWPSFVHGWFMFGSYLVQMWFKSLSLIRVYINGWSTFVTSRFRFRSSSADVWLKFGSMMDHVWFNVGPALADTTSTRIWTNREPQLQPQSMSNQQTTKTEPNLNRQWFFIGPFLVQILIYVGCSLRFSVRPNLWRSSADQSPMQPSEV